MDCLRWGEGHVDLPPNSLCACGYHPEVPQDLRDDGAGWPWYEARLSIYVHHAALPPGDVFGEGGEELAHARVTTQAPSLVDAVSKLDGELGVRWNQIIKSAPLVDQEPSAPPIPSGSFVPTPTRSDPGITEKRGAPATRRDSPAGWIIPMWVGSVTAAILILAFWALLWMVLAR